MWGGENTDSTGREGAIEAASKGSGALEDYLRNL